MSLSLDYLNKCGWTCQIVERWIPGANVRSDAFTFGDVLAYHQGKGLIALVQTTNQTHFSERKMKILDCPHRKGWKAAGGKIYVHAWGPNGLREEEL